MPVATMFTLVLGSFQCPTVYTLAAFTVDMLYVQVSTLCKSMGEYVTALGNVTARLETYKHRSLDMPDEANSAEIIQELEQSCCVFRQKLSEQAHHMAWVITKTVIL
jgi:hypothetical protein